MVSDRIPYLALQIDLAFDDADVIEEESLAAVIGRQKMQGGESIIQEKVSQKIHLYFHAQNDILGVRKEKILY